jgi:hypothetical protein
MASHFRSPDRQPEMPCVFAADARPAARQPAASGGAA